MEAQHRSGICESIIHKAVTLGASAAGITSIEALRQAPSYGEFKGMQWPLDAKSVLVFALGHKDTRAELDWWDNREGGTPGNRLLIRSAGLLKEYLSEEMNMASQPLPYAPEKGGIFLKDAAALAGLGSIGLNNLLITPQFGPRVRLRAMFLEGELEPTGPADYSPCEGCDMPCSRACPQRAIDGEGVFTRALCMNQMDADVRNAKALEGADPGNKVVKYCRACELACPVASPESA